VWIVAQSSEREPLLVLVDELVKLNAGPVLVPDLRGVVTYVLDAPKAREMFFAPTVIFHLLRDMVGDGLVLHTPGGYTLTPQGEEEARQFRERNPAFASRAAEVVRTHAVQ
jgi:hypothetical protein